MEIKTEYDINLIDYFLRAIREKCKPKAITWPKEDWETLRNFAQYNGFANLKNGFFYMGIKHFKDGDNKN